MYHVLVTAAFLAVLLVSGVVIADALEKAYRFLQLQETFRDLKRVEDHLKDLDKRRR